MFQLPLYFIKISFVIGSTVAVAALLGIYSYQNSIIYPSGLNGARDHVDTPAEYGLTYEDLTLRTKDGETLRGYLLLHDKNSVDYTNKTVMILSPNAGNIGHFLPVVKYIYEQLRYNVLIYSYRGYGKSTGTPSEKGLKIDADTVMEYVASHRQLAESSLVLYGRSLGGARAQGHSAHLSDSVAVQGPVPRDLGVRGRNRAHSRLHSDSVSERARGRDRAARAHARAVRAEQVEEQDLEGVRRSTPQRHHHATQVLGLLLRVYAQHQSC
ncbi:hypothetical protein KL948_002573 [Ogataea haglerorum]|nr:hypothetical protein KL948_002573 [Ogataea haglerorum]